MEFYHSLRGLQCKLEPSELVSLETVEQKLAESQGIDSANLLLLTSPSGHKLKPETFNSAKKVFVYDKSWISEYMQLSNIPALPLDPYLTPQFTTPKAEVCLEAAQTALTHLKHNVSVIHKQLAKLEQTKDKLQADISVCKDWPHSWHALLQIPELASFISGLLDKQEISHQFEEMCQVWQDCTSELHEIITAYKSLSIPDTTALTNTVVGVKEAQESLLNTLKKASSVQSRISLEIRKSLRVINDGFKKVDQLKTTVAQVIDIPFVYGVLKIEYARRLKWESDLKPIHLAELKRRQQWQKHYCEGSVGAIVTKLEKMSGLELSKADEIHGDKNTNPFQEVDEYISQLENLGLTEICTDLRKELDAMQRQFSRSMSASISSILPSNTSVTTLNESGTIATYESRIRKFEILLMQARMSNNTHELDIVRAETRAEARAEAKAEFRAQQQQARIDELESQNMDLMTRLQQYSKAWETVLNSMGLQTTRVDPDTGEPGAYQVNRVKGLGRKTTKSNSVMMMTSSNSNNNNPGYNNVNTDDNNDDDSRHNPGDNPGSNSNTNSTSSTTATKDQRYSLKFDKVMEQTYLDPSVLYEATSKRFGDVEKLARKLQSENRQLHDNIAKLERDFRQRVALRSFRADDLILFLPTRDSHRQPNIWAAFNARAPHYFLHPQHTKHLKTHEYLLARATAVEKRVVDGKTENPFGLPHGVEWYLITIDGEWAV